MAQPSENRTRTAALDLHGLARMQNVTAIRHDNRTDDGSGLEGRITNGNVSFVLNHNNENGKRLREDSVSSSGDGLDDSFHVPDSKCDYAHRTVKPGTIKACNECRQQKLKCDVVKEPFQSCSRCRRLKIECKVDVAFKRIGKRNKHAEMQREIEELRKQLAEQKAQNSVYSASLKQGVISDVLPSPASVTTLTMQRLEDVALSGERLGHLYNQFFTYYHSFLPFLDPAMNSDQYFNLCPLLGWTIVLVAARRFSHEPTLLANLSAPYTKLLWASLCEMPQSYHVVKALALYCTWPLPFNSSSVDPTFMISGIMMQIALQTGLHRPLHAQDFGKYVKDIKDSDVKDRTVTWAVCNIICQNASNGYGQPSTTIYDWTLGLGLSDKLSGELETQLKIAKFCQNVTKNLYSNASDPIGLIPENGQRTMMSILRTEYQELETSISNTISPTNKIYLLAASLHLHNFAFFVAKSTPTRHSELSHLYHSATSYIQACLDHDLHSTSLLYHCPNWLQQSVVSASCTLLKLLNSSFAKHLDIVQGKSLFNSAVLALRTISVKNNDIPARLAEALGRMWRAAGSGLLIGTIGIANEQDDGLELRIRCRMSFSHVFDCIWGWRGTLTLQQAATLPTSIPQEVASTTGLGGDDLTTAMLPYSPQQSLQPFSANGGVGIEDAGFMMSSLQDFDLFNSLDWMGDSATFMPW